MTATTAIEEIGESRLEGARGTKLRGRVAFVTGGTRGIGAAISKSLASQGATVAAGYGRNSEQAQKFLAELSAAGDGAEVSVHQGDVGSADDCRRTIREVIDLHGRLDILINNAGITIDKTVAKMTEDEWNKVIGVNLSGAFFLAQAALAHMLERGSGRIVMVSSVIGETGAIGQANYAASKAGLFGLTKTLAREACFQKGRTGKLAEAKTVSASRSTRSHPGMCRQKWSSPSPRRSSTASRAASRCAGWPSHGRSHGWCISWLRTLRATSLGRFGG